MNFAFLVRLATAFAFIATTTTVVAEENVNLSPGPACGVPAIEPIGPVERIIGGIPARPYSWPWMCQLEIQYSGEWEHQCGADIYNSRYLITAAHCLAFVDINLKEDAAPSRLRVRCGIYNITKPGPHVQLSGIANYTFHELFNDETMDYDIGVIELATPLTLNDYVQPICLPQKEVEPGTVCAATGWGITSEEGPDESDVLRQVYLQVFPQSQCNSSTAAITERMICAGVPAGDKSACHGDSGGPLACKVNGVWELHGIASFITSPDVKCAEKYYPIVFTRVTALMPWIKQHTKEPHGQVTE